MNKKKSQSVFYISLVVVLGIALWGIIAPESFGVKANGVFDYLTTSFGWLYLITMFSFIIFAIVSGMVNYSSDNVIKLIS